MAVYTVVNETSLTEFFISIGALRRGEKIASLKVIDNVHLQIEIGRPETQDECPCGNEITDPEMDVCKDCR